MGGSRRQRKHYLLQSIKKLNPHNLSRKSFLFLCPHRSILRSERICLGLPALIRKVALKRKKLMFQSSSKKWESCRPSELTSWRRRKSYHLKYREELVNLKKVNLKWWKTPLSAKFWSIWWTNRSLRSINTKIGSEDSDVFDLTTLFIYKTGIIASIRRLSLLLHLDSTTHAAWWWRRR